MVASARRREKVETFEECELDTRSILNNGKKSKVYQQRKDARKGPE